MRPRPSTRLSPPRRAAWRRGRAARHLALLVGVLLLWAQMVLVTHVHAEGHGHGDEESDLPCSVCLFKAAGHEQLGPLDNGATMSLPPRPASAAPSGQVRIGTPAGWRFRQPARGPPQAVPTA